ncbi:tetratricopeptide repeat protein, partial [Roseicella sp. DB1501]|uniref:tetratricopeptide repeat protein n=1 Tax=Roseicella sp. DB1501 TaxID=2730925 RepID=UPI0017B5FF3E|nr:hypothetical protein [Roseicella sp. DB1501]
MSRCVTVAEWGGQPRASIVFVHGLGGHAYGTWRRGEADGTLWPLWLAEDVPGLSVHTLAYEAPATNWLGTAMALQDRAVNLLETLLGTPGLATGPVVFVCHSLGGLLVKQILLDLDRQKGQRPEAASLLARVARVVFIATPHTGSRQGSLLDRLRFLAWPTPIARGLVANDPSLRAINIAYRGLAQARGDRLRHLIFVETRDTAAGRIVDEASSDPGLPGRPPIPIDADHIGIAKPADRNALLYARTRDFIAEQPAGEGQGTALSVHALPRLDFEQPWNLIPKLIRIGLLLLLAAIGFKGVQALIAPPPPVDTGRIERQLAEQGDLIRQLLANRTTPPAPGAERAVGEAVAAAAEGAARGDARLQTALDLLKANRVAEAEALFQAVATEKAERIRQDRRDAAAAFRNLGAIAGLRDPKRALEAYRQAAELDPEDIESIYWTGWLSLERGDLGEAEARLRTVLRLAGANGQDWYEYWARLGLGDVKRARGDLSAAMGEYRQAAVIAERLVQADPGNAGWQRDLSVSRNKIGDVLVAQGNLPAALQAYRDGLAIAERLAQADPGNAGWQRDLSVSYDRVGDVLVAQGNLTAALQAYRDGLAIRERLAKADPGTAEWQRDLSVSRNKIGDVLVAQGSLPAALQAYRDGLAIAERLARADPGNAGWQRDLSVSRNKIGDVLVAQGSLPAALQAYHDSLAIRERLAKADPGTAEWQRDLSVSRNKIGDVLVAQGSLPAAL